MASFKKLFVIASVLGVVGAGMSVVGLAGATTSPRTFVSSHYTRASRYDIGRDAVAYTSPLAPTAVNQAITHAWRPTDSYTSTGGYYLRYNDDSVVVKAAAGVGSLILLENMRTAYTRYSPVVGGFWHYNTRQSTARGGGPGVGK
jgi:hypothetical protein